MGHESSKLANSSSDESSKGTNLSHREKVKKRLGRYRHRFPRGGSGSGVGGSSSVSHHKPLKEEDFAGIALVRLISAEMKFKDKWLACISLGEQTYRTQISDQTSKPIWNSEKKLLLERNGAHIARISVYETNRVSKNNLIGYCEMDLLEFLIRDSNADYEVLDLLDSSSNSVVGSISVSCLVEDPIETEKSFARRILSIVDYNEDGQLSFSEFSDLIGAFGNQLAADKKEELFKAADKNGDGVVSLDELAVLLAVQQEKEPLINCCPVCGEILHVSDMLNNMIHLTLCFDEGTGNQVMTGGFLTDKQASNGWMFKLSEWAEFSSYEVGLRSGSGASHILVCDRRKKRLVEEIIDGKIVLSMRAIYQSKFGLGLMDNGAKELLQKISEKQGRKMSAVDSAKDIPKFINFFKLLQVYSGSKTHITKLIAKYVVRGLMNLIRYYLTGKGLIARQCILAFLHGKDQINMDEVKYPLEHFKTFNEFFIRELKPGARPIAFEERDDIAVCAADCRLMAFDTASEAMRFWIKGKKFSIQGLLGEEAYSNSFIDGTLVIFRLAPQDYHRFHMPVTGIVEKFVHLPGCLYTVNPIAVNSKYCNVFTENKRVVSIISTSDFGKVAFVAIGATMVGSITFLKQQGDHVRKGDEFGYFSFGGSTVICVFEKDAIKLDEDLLENSKRSLETLVAVGMKLGESIRKKADVLPN